MCLIAYLLNKVLVGRLPACQRKYDPARALFDKCIVSCFLTHKPVMLSNIKTECWDHQFSLSYGWILLDVGYLLLHQISDIFFD
jgi:hypothetical protein